MTVGSDPCAKGRVGPFTRGSKDASDASEARMRPMRRIGRVLASAVPTAVPFPRRRTQVQVKNPRCAEHDPTTVLNTYLSFTSPGRCPMRMALHNLRLSCAFLVRAIGLFLPTEC